MDRFSLDNALNRFLLMVGQLVTANRGSGNEYLRQRDGGNGGR
jgi:hypothetical protein